MKKKPSSKPKTSKSKVARYRMTVIPAFGETLLASLFVSVLIKPKLLLVLLLGYLLIFFGLFASRINQINLITAIIFVVAIIFIILFTLTVTLGLKLYLSRKFIFQKLTISFTDTEIITKRRYQEIRTKYAVLKKVYIFGNIAILLAKIGTVSGWVPLKSLGNRKKEFVGFLGSKIKK